MSGISVDRYRQIVGDQALDFEQRLHRADATILAEPIVNAPGMRWRVTLSLPGGAQYIQHAPLMATALYLAATAAGLTTGLVPPPEGVSW